MEWISVNDRLPNDEWKKFTDGMDFDIYPLLATIVYKRVARYVTMLFYTGEDFENAIGMQFTASVTHWMPLPEPPKEDA